MLSLLHGAETPEDLLHVWRDRRGKCDLFRRSRMHEGEPVSVEGLAVELFHRVPEDEVRNGPGPVLSSVQGVAEDGMADRGQVNPDLVGPARLRPDLK